MRTLDVPSPANQILYARQACITEHHGCQLVESDYFSVCDCDDAGQEEFQWGADWWREYTHCESFACYHVSKQQEQQRFRRLCV